MSKELVEQLQKKPEFLNVPEAEVEQAVASAEKLQETASLQLLNVEDLALIAHTFQQAQNEELARIAGLTDKLKKIKLFASLNVKDLSFIAQAGKLVSYERGNEIIKEGATDKVFYVIIKGHVRVWSKMQDSQRRLLNYHEAGDFFGELIFFEGHQTRAATVDVVEDVELVCFEQDGFDRIVHHEQISDYLRNWAQERIRRSNQPFSGKHWDEISVILAHKSWVALVRIIFFPIMIILLAWAIMLLLGRFGIVSWEIVASILVAVTVGMGLWVFWMVEDWRNDEFIVTSKRLIHIERVLVPPFPVERHEAPIDQVQDVVTRNHGLWTALFKVRSLEIKTAGAGVIRFPYLNNPEYILDQIFHARGLARTRRNVEEKSRIRQSLRKELNLPIPELSALPSGVVPVIPPKPKGLLKLIHYFIPRTRIVEPNQIIWRKHWLILVKEAGFQFVLFLLALALFIIALAHPGILGNVPWYIIVPPTAIALLASLGWYVWCYDGWRNDIYIVTDSRIIDVEGSPFHLQKESRTEGAFDTIQNTEYSSPNWLARILRIGHVTISTAAKKDAFTFDYVARPDEVQQEIFKRLTAFRERKEKADSDRQSAEFTKWFGIYHRSVSPNKE